MLHGYTLAHPAPVSKPTDAGVDSFANAASVEWREATSGDELPQRDGETAYNRASDAEAHAVALEIIQEGRIWRVSSRLPALRWPLSCGRIPARRA